MGLLLPVDIKPELFYKLTFQKFSCILKESFPVNKYSSITWLYFLEGVFRFKGLFVFFQFTVMER